MQLNALVVGTYSDLRDYSESAYIMSSTSPVQCPYLVKHFRQVTLWQ